MEHYKRTLIKTVTWRIIAFLTTMVVVYIYTGNFHESLVIGVGANLVKMVFYYFHERIWNKINYGRMQRPEYEI